MGCGAGATGFIVVASGRAPWTGARALCPTAGLSVLSPSGVRLRDWLLGVPRRDGGREDS